MTSVNLGKQHPSSYESLVKLNAVAEAAMEAAGLDSLLLELVKIRVSQINGCAFCLRMHTRDADGDLRDGRGVLRHLRQRMDEQPVGF